MMILNSKMTKTYSGPLSQGMMIKDQVKLNHKKQLMLRMTDICIEMCWFLLAWQAKFALSSQSSNESNAMALLISQLY